MKHRSAEEAGTAAAVLAGRESLEHAATEVIRAARAWVDYRAKRKSPGPGSHPSLTAQLTSRVEELDAAEAAYRRLETLARDPSTIELAGRVEDPARVVAERAREAFTLRELLAIACIREGGDAHDQPKTARRLLGRANRNGLIVWRSGTTGLGWYFTDAGRVAIQHAGSERLTRGRS